jgi:hypothetical protein
MSNETVKVLCIASTEMVVLLCITVYYINLSTLCIFEMHMLLAIYNMQQLL